MIWHVTPNNDLHPHDDNSECKCNPRLMNVNGNTIVVHNSYDGREGMEWLKEQICYCLDWQKKEKCDGNCHT